MEQEKNMFSYIFIKSIRWCFVKCFNWIEFLGKFFFHPNLECINFCHETPIGYMSYYQQRHRTKSITCDEAFLQKKLLTVNYFFKKGSIMYVRLNTPLVKSFEKNRLFVLGK